MARAHPGAWSGIDLRVRFCHEEKIILQDNGPLRCPCNDATILFLKPIPDAKLAQRLALLKAKFALPGDREIAASFYFDLTLRAMLAVRLVNR